MFKQFSIAFMLLFSLILSALPASAFLGEQKNGQFLPADQAFIFNFKQQGSDLTLTWDIQPGYYLYQKQLKIIAEQAEIGVFVPPKGKDHIDEFFGNTIVYFNNLTLQVPILLAPDNALIQVTYQGCAEAGYCYPPETKTVPLSAVVGSAVDSTLVPTLVEPLEVVLPASSEDIDQPFSPLWALLFGIGVAFTPCVLPMYPLISSLILGQNRPKQLKKIFWLAFCYVQGMAITYTLLGIVIAIAGMQFQAALQHPVVLISLSLLFVLLALSMFGLFNLQLPSSMQTRLVNWSNKQKNGSGVGVFAMGALAGLICTPCTTAPLSAILLYIAQSNNAVTGGLTLYLYALGMGLPLIGVAMFGHKLLPRSGPWMQYVKEAFGFLILVLPVVLLERILGDLWGERLASLLAMAFFAWAFSLSLRKQAGWARCCQVIFAILIVLAATPLQRWVWSTEASLSHPQGAIFSPVKNWPEIQQKLITNADKLVMLDLYADWCVACKEFEKYTFTAPSVLSSLQDVLLLQANVTDNTPEQQALLQQLNIYGLPTIIFYYQGVEVEDSRIYGFMDAQKFNEHLKLINKKIGEGE